jgi:biotin-(acetyl-CoA carboxylase) ligase
LDGINQVTVETLNLVVAGQQQQGHGQQGQQY